MSRPKIGEVLAAARREAGMSQEAAAAELGVSRARISGIESSSSLRLTTIRRLCALYKITIEIGGEADE